MGWMWGLLAVLVVLVVVAFLVARHRRAVSGRADDAVTGGRQDADGPREAPEPAVPDPDGDGAPEPGTVARPVRDAGPRSDDAARAEDAPGAWDDGDRPVPPPAGRPDSEAAAAGVAPAGAVPAQAGPADPPAPAPEPSTERTTSPVVDAGDEQGSTGRHALRDDVEPPPLPGARVPEQADPADPLPTPSRSGGTAAATGTAAGGSALAGLDSQLIGPAAASGPVPQGTRPGPFPGSVLAPEDGSDPPETHRVKVHSGSRRFHDPESPYYVRTRADLYFTGESAARAAGFMAWNERPGAR